MLAGAARGGTGSKGGGGPVRLTDVDTFPGFPFILQEIYFNILLNCVEN